VPPDQLRPFQLYTDQQQLLTLLSPTSADQLLPPLAAPVVVVGEITVHGVE
jgi:hypothetical protein